MVIIKQSRNVQSIMAGTLQDPKREGKTKVMFFES